jgi:nucleoside-diphosphate-sugar epimerase
MAHWLVLGAGYTGTALARALVAAGDDVTVTRRTLAAARATAAAIGSSVGAHALELARSPLGGLPVADVVVGCAPPGADPAAEAGALAVIAGRARLVYLSSTAVYGAGHGAWVDETAPIAPITDAGRARAAVEAGLPAAACILRVAGIYGPGRGMIDRLRAGTYRVIGDGSAHVSRVHVDDLVAAIVAAGRAAITGAINVADDDPAPIGPLSDAVAALLGLPPPPRIAAAEVSAELAGMLTADRRIDNTRMKRVLGVVLAHPRVAY